MGNTEYHVLKSIIVMVLISAKREKEVKITILAANAFLVTSFPPFSNFFAPILVIRYPSRIKITFHRLKFFSAET